MFYFHRNRYTKPSVNFVNEDPKSLANKIAERKQLNKPSKIKCKKCCTTSTPEWCSGPNNKKSLCNVCGLKWSKSQKKESIDENSSLNRGVKRRAHSFDFITPTVEIPFLENPSKQKTKDNDKKKSKRVFICRIAKN